MVIVISLAAMIGGFATGYALWGFGPLLAAALSPFGGSLFALLAAVLLAAFPWKKRSGRHAATKRASSLIRSRQQG